MVKTFLAVLCIKAKNGNVEGFIAKKISTDKMYQDLLCKSIAFIT